MTKPYVFMIRQMSPEVVSRLQEAADNIDVTAVKSRGVIVTNDPEGERSR